MREYTGHNGQAGPFSYRRYCLHIAKRTSWGDHVVAYALSLFCNWKITMVDLRWLQEHRVRHFTRLVRADIVMGYLGNRHCVATGECVCVCVCVCECVTVSLQVVLCCLLFPVRHCEVFPDGRRQLRPKVAVTGVLLSSNWWDANDVHPEFTMATARWATENYVDAPPRDGMKHINLSDGVCFCHVGRNIDLYLSDCRWEVVLCA